MVSNHATLYSESIMIVCAENHCSPFDNSIGQIMYKMVHEEWNKPANWPRKGNFQVCPCVGIVYTVDKGESWWTSNWYTMTGAGIGRKETESEQFVNFFTTRLNGFRFFRHPFVCVIMWCAFTNCNHFACNVRKDSTVLEQFAIFLYVAKLCYGFLLFAVIDYSSFVGIFVDVDGFVQWTSSFSTDYGNSYCILSLVCI